MWPDAGKGGAGARRGGCFPCGGNGGGLFMTCSVGGRDAHGTCVGSHRTAPTLRDVMGLRLAAMSLPRELVMDDVAVS